MRENLPGPDSAPIPGENPWDTNLDPRTVRACCGQRIAPHLAEMRDDSGSSFFVSVWRCPRCGRATS